MHVVKYWKSNFKHILIKTDITPVESCDLYHLSYVISFTMNFKTERQLAAHKLYQCCVQ